MHMPDELSSLLCRVIAARGDAGEAAALLAIFDDLDQQAWQVVAEQAIAHRLGFVLHQILAPACDRFPRLPPDVMAHLRESGLRHATVNLGNQARLRRILAACVQGDVPVMLVKGFWLTETVYADTRERSSGDLDLLIRPRDTQRFTELARSLGFEVPDSASDVRALAPAGHEFTLIQPGRPGAVDLHWHLIHPCHDGVIDEQSLWDRSVPASLGQVVCRVPCLEDHLLFVCFHAAVHHRFAGVGPRALMDVQQLMWRAQRTGIDWSDVVARAREFGWSDGVWLLLDLAREQVGAAVPRGVLEALEPSRPPGADVRRAALEEMMVRPEHARTVTGNMLGVMQARTLRERAQALRETLFPGRAVLAGYFQTTSDDPRMPWLHLKRWGRMAAVHGPVMWRVLRGSHAERDAVLRAAILRGWLANQPRTAHGLPKQAV